MIKEIPTCPKCGSELVAPFQGVDKLDVLCTNCGYFGASKMKPGDVKV